jgi:ATP-dependent Lhr-like helicase
MRDGALRTAKLMSDYGKPAAVALSGRKLRVSDVEEILEQERELSDRFFELVIEAERNALKRRFW